MKIGFYKAHYAQLLSRKRKQIKGCQPKKIKGLLRQKKSSILEKDYTPEQITG